MQLCLDSLQLLYVCYYWIRRTSVIKKHLGRLDQNVLQNSLVTQSRAVWKLVWLITKRSGVRIPPVRPNKSPQMRAFSCRSSLNICMTYKRIINNIFASNTQYLPYVQLSATALVLLYSLLFPQSGLLWLLSVLMYVCIGAFGVSIGYHRLLSHKSFKTSKFWEYFCSTWGALAFTGSAVGWVGMHRDHHRFSDREGDPHSPHVSGLKMLVAAYDYEPKKLYSTCSQLS